MNDLFLKYFVNAALHTPDDAEIVVCIDMSYVSGEPYDLFSGIPLTLGYYDEQKNTWYDASYIDSRNEDVDFRDINHNVCGNKTVTHWISKTSLSMLLKKCIISAPID